MIEEVYTELRNRICELEERVYSLTEGVSAINDIFEPYVLKNEEGAQNPEENILILEALKDLRNSVFNLLLKYTDKNEIQRTSILNILKDIKFLFDEHNKNVKAEIEFLNEL